MFLFFAFFALLHMSAVFIGLISPHPGGLSIDWLVDAQEGQPPQSVLSSSAFDLGYYSTLDR